MGNILHQSKFTDNSALIHYAKSSDAKSGISVYIVNNTVSSSRHAGIFVLNQNRHAECFIANNLLVGKLDIAVGKNEEKNNLFVSKSCFAPKPSIPYALKADCAAVHAGLDLHKIKSADLVPRFEYFHPLSKINRPQIGKIDIGAYEYE